MDDGTDDQSDALRRAAAEVSGRDGMVVAVAMQWIIMDEDGVEAVGGYYTGGMMNAIGLVTQAQDELLFDFYGDRE